MKPINFKESNKILKKPSTMSDEECGDLYVLNDGQQSLSCWKLSWKEWFSILFFGKIWLCILSGYTPPPAWLWCVNNPFEDVKD